MKLWFTPRATLLNRALLHAPPLRTASRGVITLRIVAGLIALGTAF